ncbi:phosphogluconate dehydrogenase (NAD(+)-dependent, decarboxylating) [Enterococcus sp. LJL98]
MEIHLIGLGKMGFNIAINLLEKGHSVKAFDQNKEIAKALEAQGGIFYSSVEELLTENEEQKIVWLMLPAGAITNTVMDECLTLLNPGDILIDGGNSKYTDSKTNNEKFKEKEIAFFDVGTSGGVSGARNGACMMIGGNREVFQTIEPIFTSLCVENGYLFCGEAGSGHYLKMIHNGIEYGMMQAIGEGFNILHHSEYDYDLEGVAKVFNHGSVIRSWLMELTENLLSDDAQLSEIEGVIASSGEGKWTVEEVLRLELSAPVITQSLLTRYASTDQEKYGEKVIASLRNQFGGHAMTKKGENE